ncbi:MAG: type II secretion system F family protein, partial [Planctomycetota bacterium]
AEAVRNGESGGKLASVLTAMSDYFDEDNQQAVRSLTKTVEPVIIAFMGVMIGGVAISMFLPLFDVTASAGVG